MMGFFWFWMVAVSLVGYVVLDADLTGHDSHGLLDDIRALDGTIRARLVYEN